MSLSFVAFAFLLLYPNSVQASVGNQVVRVGKATTTTASALNESLSILGYLPVSFHPAHKVTQTEAMNQLASDSQPLPGRYTWLNQSTAKQLHTLWQPFVDNIITKGAVMRFEADHHLAVDGIAGPKVSAALAAALRTGHGTTNPYVFITVDEQAIETLRVWENGKVVLSSPTNTGIAQSPTSPGTWPIYLRFVSQEMSGTTPWGTSYDDPGVPYVSYFHGGDAVHGFSRPSYGTPQSLGCVELPIAASRQVFDLVNYGTLVSVRTT